MKKTGGDYFTLTEIRAMLREANDAFDGGATVAIVFPDDGACRTPYLSHVEETLGGVVYLPGDGVAFPERAFAEALRVAPVIIERE
jgi:hypothetical protein